MSANDELHADKISTLSEEIAEQLVEAVLSGSLKEGVRLNESQLSRELHVSRAPIREALKQLQEQGLVVHRARRGMFVVSLTKEDLDKINRLRVVMESEAMMLCRANLTPESERKLQALLEKMERASMVSPLEAVRMDMAFHQMIWSLTGNEYLERILRSLTAPQFAQGLIRITLASQSVIFKYHWPLMEFILGKERREHARRLIMEHLTMSPDGE